jgi:hypothetical protein
MTLLEQLKDLLVTYFRKFPNVSINALAKKSGVGATTLRRILSESLKGDPAPSTVLNVVSAITKERRLSSLLRAFEGPIGEMLRSSFGHFVEENLPHSYSTDLNRELVDWPKYLIYKLASNKCGVSRILLTQILGNVGLKCIGEMFEKGLLYADGDIVHSKEKNFSLDLNLAVKHLPNLLGFYKPNDLDRGHNLFYTLSESINEDGIKKVKEVQKEAIKKIYAIMNSPYYEGEIPYFTVHCMDTLTLETP